ncbi:flagellar protein [Clostridium niameyense]|uniref:Flagellar protein n=1 Tax=Clostridium niameyense TaxID=1622073 RepID=A0A6M0R9N2_9CLOT|nr:flagellar brake domain-containing protein [Clostridium niameyense]NEZ45908.1 flagellar protein [Clostridium niameyense]
MNDNVEFHVNKKVEIEWEDGYYICTIQDVTEDNIYVNIPVKDGKYLPLHAREKVTALYFVKNYIFRFHTIVVGRKVDKILLIALKKPQKLVRVQRRNFVRISVVLKTSGALIKEIDDIHNIKEGILPNPQFDFFNMTILDLSGGGARISTEKDLELKQEIILNIPFKEETITVKGRIVRKCRDKGRSNIYGIKFLELEDKNRETIIRFIFSTMRKQVKRT